MTARSGLGDTSGRLFTARLRHIWIAAMTVLMVVSPAGATQNNEPSGPLPLFEQGSKALKAVGLPSDTHEITVYFSGEQYRDRAKSVQGLVEGAIDFYQDALAIDHKIDVVLFNETDWQKYIGQAGPPYGLPFIAGSYVEGTQIAIVPATANGVVSQGALALGNYAQEETLAKVPLTNRTFEDGASAFTDVIAIHELGHAYTTAYGIGPYSAWMNEFLATYFAYAYLREKHPDLATVFEIYAYHLNADAPNTRPDYSLKRLETLYVGVGPQDYTWYQGMFVGLAMQVYDEMGLALFPELRAAFPRDENSREFPGGADTLDEEFETLAAISPVFGAWRDTVFSQTMPEKTQEKTMQEQAKADVLTVMTLYTEGTYEGDADKLSRSFHEKAVMNGYLGGKLLLATPSVFIDDITKQPIKDLNVPYKSKISHLEIKDNIATVILEETGFPGDMAFTNYFHLINDGSGWKIISKTFHSH